MVCLTNNLAGGCIATCIYMYIGNGFLLPNIIPLLFVHVVINFKKIEVLNKVPWRCPCTHISEYTYGRNSLWPWMVGDIFCPELSFCMCRSPTSLRASRPETKLSGLLSRARSSGSFTLPNNELLDFIQRHILQPTSGRLNPANNKPKIHGSFCTPGICWPTRANTLGAIFPN